jgi:hypothetical protein
MRHLGIVASSAPQAFAPTVSVSSVTNFNQNRGTFNGTISANGAITTTIKFQISLNNSTWFDASGGTTITNTSSDNVSVYYNATGLSAGTLYYVRLVATNSAGTSNSTSTSFTTWSLKTYRNGPSGSNDTLTGSQTFTIPTVTPTGGTQVIPTVLNVFVAGGGGGARTGWFDGGGGGGYRSASSRTFSNTSGTTLTIAIGGGAAQSGVGGTSSISATNFTSLSATGGNPPSDDGGGNGIGGSTPANDNIAYSGGSGPYVISKDDSGFAGGGGAGAAGNGTSGTASTSGSTGGNGGAGYHYSTGNFNVGPGGFGSAGGNGTLTNGTLGANSGAINSVGPYGKGGNGVAGSGTIGVVFFQYYAA